MDYDSYATRIDNDGGAWEGVGTFFWVTENEEEQVDMETMQFTGTDGYEGLYAYVYADWQEDPPVRGIITSLEHAPYPDPVPAPTE